MKDLAIVRNDVVGSLLRPERLKRAHQDYEDGKITTGILREIEDQEIRQAVRLQEQLGRSGASPPARPHVTNFGAVPASLKDTDSSLIEGSAVKKSKHKSLLINSVSAEGGLFSLRSARMAPVR